MAGKTPYKAYNEYLKRIASSVGCITNEKLIGPHRSEIADGAQFVLSTGENVPIMVSHYYGDARRKRVWIYVGQVCRIIRDPRPDYGPYRVTTLKYKYQVLIGTASEEAEEAKEIIEFHYTQSPDRSGSVAFPHAHVRARAIARPFTRKVWSLHRVHLPTDRVSVEQFIEMVINDFGAKPTRRDAIRLLRENDRRFRNYRTPL